MYESTEAILLKNLCVVTYIFVLDKKDFNWTKDDRTTRYDGPTMLLICLQLVNPSNNTGVVKYISKIEQATMSKYSNKVPDMLDDMKMYHNSARRR